MKTNNTAIVSGAAGFSGAVLTKELLKKDVEVYALVRPGSSHNARLKAFEGNLHVIEIDPADYDQIPNKVNDKIDVFFHLMWGGDKTAESQDKNIGYTMAALESAKKCGCFRFICTGSQGEYGVVPPDEVTYEDRKPEPFTAYGKAKVEACKRTKVRAKELGIEWVWGRIFSLIGEYEPAGRMLPDLYHNLKEGKEMSLSSCRQNWDYLDVYDAADAIIALAGDNVKEGIYNIAKGEYKPLREFTEELRMMISPDTKITYGNDPEPFVSLQPNVDKLKALGWSPKRSFADSIRGYE